MVGFHALGASLDLLSEMGLAHEKSTVADCVLQIAGHAMTRLEQIGAHIVSPREDACRSGIVTFTFGGRDPQELRKACIGQNVALACRDGKLRISPHAYNDEEDVERLIAALGNA